MIKNDFGHLGCPYYEEKLENGITLILIPRKSKLKSAGIYIGKVILSMSGKPMVLRGTRELPSLQKRGSGVLLSKRNLQAKESSEIAELIIPIPTILWIPLKMFILDSRGSGIRL